MVNMPINVSTFPTDELGLVSDINQNINQEYYEWLLKQHNYFPDCAFHKEKFEDTIKMEHSYTRDWKPTGNNEIMGTRTILIERPPLCPSCNQLPPNHDEKVEIPEPFNIPVPSYNEEAGRNVINATEEMIKSCHNRNSESDDWTRNIQKFSWTEQQLNLFERVERILDMDQLGRLVATGLSNEYLRRNAIIEKSVSRMRAALGSVHWEPRLTSWLHSLLMIHLPSNYMVSYIDILQSLKRKIPTLVDKMLYHKPIEMHKDYMNAIIKRTWEPTMITKTRTLPSNPVIVLISTIIGPPNQSSSREKRWIELLGTLTSVEIASINPQRIDPEKTIEQVTEQLVAVTRAKIQQIRNQTPNRHIILAGFNAGAAIGIQVALVELVTSIICLGYAFNTLNGVHGNPDDRILNLTIPVLFIIGQNAQRSSQEEIESLRERMSAQTLLVVVGSSDDALRVKRSNRSMEGVSQSMIDNMILDEIQEFATSCISNPPGPRKPKHVNGQRKVSKHRGSPLENGLPTKRKRVNGVQKFKSNGQPRIKSLFKQHKLENGINDDASLQLAIQSVLPSDVLHIGNGKSASDMLCENKTTVSNGSPIRQKVKYIPANRFVHIKPPPVNTQKIYVKQQNDHQSYTLGVKSISTSDIPPIQNKFITVKISDESKHAPIKSNSNLDNIDIFDIPILFADGDGNIEYQNGKETPKTTSSELESDSDVEIHTESQPQPTSQNHSTKIQILSDEIVNGTIIENGTTHNDKSNESNGVKNMAEHLTPSKDLTNSGNFLVLNKCTLSQMKTVNGFPSGQFKKLIFSSKTPAENRATTNGSTIITSSSDMRVIGQRFSKITRISTTQNNNVHSQTNGRTASPKSGIIIKRNHLKNIMVRKVNVQSMKPKDTKANVKEIDQLDKSNDISANDSKDDSLKNLIDDLES